MDNEVRRIIVIIVLCFSIGLCVYYLLLPMDRENQYRWFCEKERNIAYMDQEIQKLEKDVVKKKEQYEKLAGKAIYVKKDFEKEKQMAEQELSSLIQKRNELTKKYNFLSEKFDWRLYRTDPNKPKEHILVYQIEKKGGLDKIF